MVLELLEFYLYSIISVEYNYTPTGTLTITFMHVFECLYHLHVCF